MFSRAACRASARSLRNLSANLSSARPQPVRYFARFPARPRLPRHSGQHTGRRHASKTVEGAKVLFKRHPFTMALATACILFGFAVHLYAPYVYQHYVVGVFHNFPEPVAIKLRRALYFSQERSLSPKDVVKYYRQALQVADEIGMDPFSDEILGVKFQLASFFEKMQNHQRAIDLLEIVRRDCLRWMDALGDKHWNDGKRTRVLAKTIGISVKLGDLYSNEFIQNREKAEESLVYAVETTLKEKARREKDGVKEGEGDWITDEEMGASMEALAHHYEEMNQHYLATPLFLQALTHAPPKSCHAATLMNNLAISLSQQRPPPGFASTAPNPASGASRKQAATTPALPTTQALVEQARLWATKAVNLASGIAPPDRTEECDMACATATHNLGEFAEMQGRVAEARRRYVEAASLAKGMKFEEGVRNAEEGVKRLVGRE